MPDRNSYDYFDLYAIIRFMKRLYTAVLLEHFSKYEQMAFLCGPRQVGKTTISKQCEAETTIFKHLNWDNFSDRTNILAGDEQIVSGLPIHALLPKKPLLTLDEIHKYQHWKTFLKGFIDTYKGELQVLVTGSAKLNVFRRGGDSLLGRYFLYRVHPLSIAELTRTILPQSPCSLPSKIQNDVFAALIEFGGFPEPFLKAEKQFYRRWQRLKQQQMMKEDIRDLSRVQELAQLDVLAAVLQHQVGQLTSFSNLAKKIRVSDQTIRRWIQILESLYYCFTIRPWSKNVPRSLLKEPKIYLWDWSQVPDTGMKIENFVASHLLKAIHFWNDMGFGEYELYFVRDKEQREIDFLITEEQKPWILIEVKSSGKIPISKHLHTFFLQLKPQHAFQIVFDLPYVDQDCMRFKIPKIVPAQTFLSQLV